MPVDRCLIEGMEGFKDLGGELVCRQGADPDPQSCHLPSFAANGLAAAARERREKVRKAAVPPVVAMKLDAWRISQPWVWNHSTSCQAQKVTCAKDTATDAGKSSRAGISLRRVAASLAKSRGPATAVHGTATCRFGK